MEPIQNEYNEICCTYKIDKENKNLRIFGDKFVENNKDMCKIVYNENEQELSGTFNTENMNTNELKIKLKGILPQNRKIKYFYVTL